MGYLFENMEKMDIQAERRNTTEARERAEKEKARADEAERKLQEAEHIFIETLQELGQDKKSIVQRVCEKFGLDEAAAEKMVNVYFK